MTTMRFNATWLVAIAAVGLSAGLGLGLLITLVMPLIGGAQPDVSTLNASAQNDYIVMVANTFAQDQDLTRAKERLAQLKETATSTRVEKLAKALAARQDVNSANVAELAVALGSRDSALQGLAMSNSHPNGEPTKFAQVAVKASATSKPTTVATPTSAPYPTLAPASATPTKANNPATTRPPKATTAPTVAPQAAAALTPDWKPSYPDQWWNAVKYIPATVAPGQKYWRLKSALYCDFEDTRNNCEDLPGGSVGTSIYVSLLDAAGNCTEANIKHVLNNGEEQPMDKKDVAYPWNKCNYDYEWSMFGEGNDISVDGLPSDKITSLCLCSVKINWSSRAHVRYFLVFQQTTR